MLLEARVFLGERWKTKLNEMKMKACDEIERAVTWNWKQRGEIESRENGEAQSKDQWQNWNLTLSEHWEEEIRENSCFVLMRNFDGGDDSEELRYEIRVKKLWWEARGDRKMIEWENSCLSWWENLMAEMAEMTVRNCHTESEWRNFDQRNGRSGDEREREELVSRFFEWK